MNEENQEIMFDLLTKKAVYGLGEAEQGQLDEMDQGTAEMEFRSLEVTAAAISMVGVSADESLPVHLRERIVDEASHYVGDAEAETEAARRPSEIRTYHSDEIFAERASPSIMSWLGWVAAAAACIALALNIWFTRFQPVEEVAQVQPTTEAPRVLTPAEKREEMLRSSANVIKANWAAGNVKDMKQVTGDIMWSDEKQAGYMRFRGLPANNAEKETYQLWIMDKTQDKSTPIDGGTFDVNANGEIVIPINAKLKAQAPYAFAVTVEKPGGVVVSKKERIAALATVETQTG